MTRSSFSIAGLIVSLALSTLIVGCGGSASNGPRPLKFRFDEVYIAQFSIEEKTAVLNANNEYQRARAEHMKAESDLRENKTKLSVTKNERKQGLLAEQSALQEKKAADKSGDMTRVNRAARDMRVAELSRRAADDKVVYVKANRKYLRKLVKYRQEETYHREARFEHEKAKLGQAKNIAPKGVRYENFKEQTDKRNRRSQKSRQQLEKDKLKVATAKKLWQARLKEVELAKGTGKSSAPSKAPTPAPAAAAESKGN